MNIYSSAELFWKIKRTGNIHVPVSPSTLTYNCSSDSMDKFCASDLK